MYLNLQSEGLITLATPSVFVEATFIPVLRHLHTGIPADRTVLIVK